MVGPAYPYAVGLLIRRYVAPKLYRDITGLRCTNSRRSIDLSGSYKSARHSWCAANCILPAH